MLIIMQGVPGSGKSTTAKRLAGKIPSAVIHSTDSYFIDSQGEYRFDPSMLSEYHTRNLAAATAALAEGYTVIVDNCNIKNIHAAPYIRFDVVRGIPVLFVRCAEQFQNVHGVPTHTVDRMRREMETLSVAECMKGTQ